MSLWLNKIEREYLMKVIQEDLETDDSFYNELISIDRREKLLKKLQDMKV
jgi:HKD family nuclease